jgi:hypothetical protein
VGVGLSVAVIVDASFHRGCATGRSQGLCNGRGDQAGGSGGELKRVTLGRSPRERGG